MLSLYREGNGHIILTIFNNNNNSNHGDFSVFAKANLQTVFILKYN